jgi:hypothetical protein
MLSVSAKVKLLEVKLLYLTVLTLTLIIMMVTFDCSLHGVEAFLRS